MKCLTSSTTIDCVLYPVITAIINNTAATEKARNMPDKTMYYLFDLLGFLRNVIQYEDGLIPIFMEKSPYFILIQWPWAQGLQQETVDGWLRK